MLDGDVLQASMYYQNVPSEYAVHTTDRATFVDPSLVSLQR
jgi:hypothetical protein